VSDFSARVQGDRGTIKVNGVDISNAITGFAFNAGVGLIPEVTLDLRVHELQYDGPARIFIPEDTEKTLRALGWKAPEEVSGNDTGDSGSAERSTEEG
jgi:hypothetical protein